MVAMRRGSQVMAVSSVMPMRTRRSITSGRLNCSMAASRCASSLPASTNISSPFSVRRAARWLRSNKGVSNSCSSSWTRLETADCVVWSLCAAGEKPPSWAIQ